MRQEYPTKPLEVILVEAVVADSVHGKQVPEWCHALVYNIPPEDNRMEYPQPTGRTS
jgi:uncharacterized protein (DUF427 family)